MKKYVLLFLILCIPFMMGVSQHIGGYALDIKTKTDTCNSTLADPPTTETDTVVWTPASGYKIVLMGIKFNSDTATTLLVESDSTAVIPLTECTASGQIVIQSATPIWQGIDDANLTYTVGTKGRHSIILWGYEID